MPTNDSVGLHEDKSSSPSGPNTIKPSPQESVTTAQLRSPAALLLKDGELVPEGDNLESYVAATPDERKHAMEDREDDSEHGAAVCQVVAEISMLSSWTTIPTGTAVMGQRPLPLRLLRGLTRADSKALLDDIKYRAGDAIQVVDLQLTTRPVTVMIVIRDDRIVSVHDVEGLRRAILRPSTAEASATEFKASPLARIAAAGV